MSGFTIGGEAGVTGALVELIAEEVAQRGVAELPPMTAVISRSVEPRKLLLGEPLNPDDIRMRGRPSKLGEIAAVAWSPGGQRIATGRLGSFGRVWSHPAGELLGIIPVFTAMGIAFYPDGRPL